MSPTWDIWPVWTDDSVLKDPCRTREQCPLLALPCPVLPRDTHYLSFLLEPISPLRTKGALANHDHQMRSYQLDGSPTIPSVLTLTLPPEINRSCPTLLVSVPFFASSVVLGGGREMCWRLAGLGPEGFVTVVLYPGEGQSRVWAGTQHGPLAGLSRSLFSFQVWCT